ncbi:beta-1,3-glucanase family protein [Piscirickettsia litoralis]|uniref:GH64 domain-containing protein n=1 Tax=Piscirickettsia litoralis TaxID=1891921 RepID=A0ABX3A9W5_9GAMM|nr:beta-1,3-glucanase family protein [Piscirickettsia litoralis]ODN42914.1 hypothetical protein BGC07_08235 [Piscirickettsia litoralis]
MKIIKPLPLLVFAATTTALSSNALANSVVHSSQDAQHWQINVKNLLANKPTVYAIITATDPATGSIAYLNNATGKLIDVDAKNNNSDPYSFKIAPEQVVSLPYGYSGRIYFSEDEKLSIPAVQNPDTKKWGFVQPNMVSNTTPLYDKVEWDFRNQAGNNRTVMNQTNVDFYGFSINLKQSGGEPVGDVGLSKKSRYGH